MRALLCGGFLAIILANTAAAQTPITLGETRKLGYSDNGNADLLLADGPYSLTQQATLDTLSFWVTHASGQLILGVYDAGPLRDCVGGNLKAQTNAFPTKANTWNTAPPSSVVTLQPGYYCLAYLPSSDSLSFRKGMTTGIVNHWYRVPFGSLPQTYSSTPSGPDGFHWSLYASLTSVPLTPTLTLSFSPSSPTLSSGAAAGSVAATVTAAWSDGSPFTGMLSFGPPYNNDAGTFALSCNTCASANIIVDPAGPGLTADANTTQRVTVVATQ